MGSVILPYLNNTSFIALFLLFVFLFGYLFYLYLLKLPDRIHQELFAKFKHELDLLTLIRAQVEPKKIDAYIKLADFMGDIITGKIKIDPNKQNELKRLSYDVGTKLFLFASDRTIQQYSKLRDYVSNQNQDTNRTLELYTEVITSMRQDLHAETKCTSNDFKNCIF